MIGETILHFKIIEKLGEGGMGVVYLAEDTKLERKVAIKFLPKHISSDSEERARFIIEAKAAATLNHPNITTIHSIEEADNEMFIVMEYIKGVELKDKILSSDEALPIIDVINYAFQIAEGLDAAHKEGITHRDIKSSNIMVTENGKVKIMDFGLAKLRGRTKLTKIGTTIGTIDYMSPEQAQGEETDQRTDIWSYGIVLYEMLTGKLPFKGNYDQAVLYSILNDDPMPVKEINPEVSLDLAGIIQKTLQKNPDSRYSSMSEIINELELYKNKIKSDTENVFSLKTLHHHLKRPKIFIPSFCILILIVIVSWWYSNQQSKIYWAKNTALPQIKKLVDFSWRDYTEAYNLEEEAVKYIPDNPELVELIARTTRKIDIITDPPGAKVYFKPYNKPLANWKYAGITPLKKLSMPISVFRWKLVKDGYDTVLAAASSWSLKLQMGSPLIPNNLIRKLDKAGSIPKGMVRVPGAQTRFGKLNDFLIDKYEVTNKQYKEFVDKGGYSNKKYWKNEFTKDGKKLYWQEAMKLFVDQTGRPGPATWQAGDYPEGQGNYPVSGISWYEACAYAEFAGKVLPSGTHWGLAMGEATPILIMPQFGGYAVFAAFSNFRGKGPLPVGSLHGMTTCGAFDMAGNVREWCLNKTVRGRLLRGGAWNDPTYLFDEPSQESPFSRSQKNGFRCALYPESQKIPERIFEMTVFNKVRYYENQEPVSDKIFRIYKEQFSYDKTDLDSRIDSRDESPREWIHETVTFNAAYGNERIIAHLFLPKNSTPPFQTVIYFPGGATRDFNSSKDLENYDEFRNFVSFFMKNGRAVLFPVLKGTFERRENGLGPELLDQGKLHKFSEYRIQLVKDYKRCIDYLDTRSDIDTNKLAYYGMSWGAIYGQIIPAIEHRLKVIVLISGGFVDRGLPEVNAINYITHVKIPTLMLNGKYDMVLPYDKAIKPAFKLLGTPEKDKELKLYETDHIPPKKEFIKETLAWLDRYLGRVK